MVRTGNRANTRRHGRAAWGFRSDDRRKGRERCGSGLFSLCSFVRNNDIVQRQRLNHDSQGVFRAPLSLLLISFLIHQCRRSNDATARADTVFCRVVFEAPVGIGSGHGRRRARGRSRKGRGRRGRRRSGGGTRREGTKRSATVEISYGVVIGECTFVRQGMIMRSGIVGPRTVHAFLVPRFVVRFDGWAKLNSGRE